MLKKQPADDLFEKSSMSFGEHLEELRKALIKAFIWLGLGTAVGLFFAERIVEYFQTPLEKAIYDFYIQHAERDFEAANGVQPSRELSALIYEKGHMPEIVFVDPLNFSKTLESVPLTTSMQSPGASSGPPSDIEQNAIPSAPPPQPEQNAVPSAPSPQSPSPTLSKQPSIDENPWQGVSAGTFERLKPVIMWKPISTRLVSLGVTEGFMIWLKAGLVAGVVIGSPGIFWHIWQFFAAGLYPHERRYVYWYLPLSLLLFLAGVSLAFFVIFRLVIGFLMNYTTDMGVEFTPRLNDYMSFALFLPLGFGIAFQLPLVMLGCHRFGLISVETFVSQWRVAVLVIAFLSMILTPAEIYSMIGLFVPLTGLYFFGILLCKYMPRGAGIGSAAFDPHD